MFTRLRALFPRRSADRAPVESVEALRADFQSRYHDFKLLITANNRALEVMADIEQALAGDAVFGMAFVRSSCTAVVVNVLQMLIRMSGLSKGKYDKLQARFDEIRAQIEAAIEEKAPAPAAEQRLVVPLNALRMADADNVGSKMAQLGEIAGALTLPVPDGFAITTAAYRRFMTFNDLQGEIDRRIQGLKAADLKTTQIACAAIQQRITQATVPPDLAEAIAKAYTDLTLDGVPDRRVAMRSSALGEDLAEQSFAGLYLSRLNVSAEDLLMAYKEIVASKYGLSAMVYRLKRGLRDEDIAMGVGCLAMVEAAAGGVMYSRHPVDPKADSVFINAVLGLPKAVVDGTGGFDQIDVGRERPLKVLRAQINPKTLKYTCDPVEGVCREVAVADGAAQPAISQAQALALAEIALKLEAHYGTPQDIEWAIDGRGALFILQSRPMSRVPSDQRVSSLLPGGTPLPPALLHGGVLACRGAACGPVFVVKKAADMLRMPAGAVMVARQALPMWSALVNRAAAVVTEEGGAAGHLAHIAREFGVPAVFGLGGALAVLQPDSIVTVDADHLKIYPGALPLSAKSAGAKSGVSAFRASSVYETLANVSRWIVPLNLLDPDAVEFQPGNCRTLHDITRFLHEKAVAEMFDFGRAHRFPEKSAKQLVDRVPLKWWVLDLDDGFDGAVKGPRVPLARIVSVPMRALWDGITAIPWDGPPPLDGKGLASVMFRSTANPSLNTGLRSRYSSRNFFMVARHFCSLNTRLGYHFCQVEALVGERVSENYLQFRFKGGAADDDRRLGRIHFIREILEEEEFIVDIRSDALTARVEKQSVARMCRHLKTVGHLIIHTRQLDMIMSNPASVRYYRDKTRSDLQRLHEGPGDLKA